MKYVIIIAVLLLLCYVLDGGLKRKRILNADQAKEGAVITELEQKKCGSGKDAHIELTVHFSDGTTYCDDCTKERRGFTKKTYWYDKEKEPIIISKAEAAHAKAVEKNKMKTK